MQSPATNFMHVSLLQNPNENRGAGFRQPRVGRFAADPESFGLHPWWVRCERGDFSDQRARASAARLRAVRHRG